MTMRINIFGATSTASSDTGSDATLSCGVKPRQILAILATHLGQAMPKEQLAELLWEGNPPKSYVASLESYVCVLRRELGLSSGRNGAFSTTSRGYRLDPEAVHVDLHDFYALVKAAANAEPGAAVELTSQALDLVRGPLLASEPYAAWAIQERAAFTEALKTACLRAAAAAQVVGDHAAALRMAAEVLKVDGLAEAAWLIQMRSLAAQGRRAEALRCFADLRNAVRDEMGVEPGREAHDLYLELLQDAGEVQPSSARAELSGLLKLLRQTLEGVPGARVPHDDAHLSAVAAQLVGAAA